VSLLPVATGFVEVTAGVVAPWQDRLNAYVRGEVGFRPHSRVDLFGFAQASLDGFQGGIGARATF
jgi:hypothetical protein